MKYGVFFEEQFVPFPQLVGGRVYIHIPVDALRDEGVDRGQPTQLMVFLNSPTLALVKSLAKLPGQKVEVVSKAILR